MNAEICILVGGMAVQEGIFTEKVCLIFISTALSSTNCARARFRRSVDIAGMLATAVAGQSARVWQPMEMVREKTPVAGWNKWTGRIGRSELMRLSKYMILYELAPYGKWLLMHGARGIFDIIGASVGDMLSQIESDAGSLERLDFQIYQFLLDRGYIVSDDFDEDACAEEIGHQLHKRAQDRLTVTFVPSYQCNFNCAYCFERDFRVGKDPDFFETVMPRSVVDGAFRYIDSCRSQGRDVVRIVLFGGEPLLPKNKDVVEWICQQCAQRRLSLSCVTNGYYLDEYVQTLRVFTEGFVKITLDGIQSVHDLRRAPTSSGSFERICKNIDTALAAGIRIGVRTNVNRANFDQIDPLTAFYRERKWTEKENFSYYFKATIPCLEPEWNRINDVDIMDRLGGQACADCHNSIYRMLYRRLSRMLCQGRFAPLQSAYCGAHSGDITIDPFGNVFSCPDAMVWDENVVGYVDTVNNGIRFRPNYAKWFESTVAQSPICKDCKLKFFCGGGCTAQSLMMHNDMKHAICNQFPEIFRAVATQIAKEQFCIRN